MTDSRTGFLDAVQALRESPDALVEIERAMPALEAHAQPCGRRAVIEALTPLVTVYGIAERSDAEWRTFWGLYATALEGLPGEALRSGVADYVAGSDSEFFPKPGPLKALCDKRAAPILTALGRARRALRLSHERR